MIKSYTKDKVIKQKLLHKSKLYYYQHYLKLGEMELAVAKAFLAVVLTEVKISHRCLEDALVMMDNGYQDKREVLQISAWLNCNFNTYTGTDLPPSQ